MPLGHEWNAPWIPFDFRVLMPHHLGQTDEQGGAYIREGKAYKRVWVHAICEGSKTRFWTSDDEAFAQQYDATQAYIIYYPGEEYAVTQNEQNPNGTDITRSLTNPLEPQSTYTTEFQPWQDQSDSESFFRGSHIMPSNEVRLGARGLSVEFRMLWCAAKTRFLGWGGEFGAGVHNIYKPDPSYPYPNP